MTGLRKTNCNAPCLHARMYAPSTGREGRQHVMASQLGAISFPAMRLMTFPGPPTYARHRERKLYTTQDS